MKSLQDFKVQLSEEEKSDYSKFDILVRAGLANKAQMQRIHKILDKMQDDRPNFNTADKMIIQNLFNKMVDLVSNNKQIFTQTRRAVREELEESLLDTSDYKIGPSGKKVKAHRIKVGDTPAKGSEQMEIAANSDMKEEVVYLEEGVDPPMVIVLRRKAIRLFPNNTRIALYHSQKLNKDFSVPYRFDGEEDAVIQAEETEAAKTLDTPGTNYNKKKFADGDDKESKKTNDMATAVKESVDPMGQLQKIKDSGQHGTVNHKDKTASKVDVQTAHAILKIHNSLKDENKKKYSDMVAQSHHHMKKAAEFAWKHLK